ncbi:MAG: hypothetical protein JXA87_15855 [Thermoleophilia bacterium]|nr:hypothetical protein [Thermoleophilia bacterium]
MDELDQSYEVFKQREPVYWIVIPLATLLVVVGLVSGLVFGGVLEGHEVREGPEHVPTTQSTVQIAP